MMFLFIWLLAIVCAIHKSNGQSTDQVPAYIMDTYTHDGLGNSFRYPQMTAVTSNDSIIVYHNAVNGIQGQAGLSIITPTGAHIRSIQSIKPSVNGELPPGNFVNVSWTINCNYMRIIPFFNQTINQTIELIEMVIPVDPTASSSLTNVGIVIDLEGRFVRSFTPSVNPLFTPFHYKDQTIDLTVTYRYQDDSIVIDNSEQTFHRVMNLYDYWHLLGGRIFPNAQPVIRPYRDTINQTSYHLIVLLEHLTTDSTIDRAVFVFDLFTNELLNQIDQPYINRRVSDLVLTEGVQIGVSINPSNDKFLICAPAVDDQNKVYSFRINPSINQTKPRLQPGQVEKVWSTTFGPLQAQAAIVHRSIDPSTNQSIDHSIFCSSVTTWKGLGHTNTVSIVCYDPRTQQLIYQFSTLTGVTDAARSNGVSSSLTDYRITSMATEPSTNLIYMAFSFTSETNDAVESGVLVINQTGHFFDYLPGYQVPPTVFFTHDNLLAVADQSNHSIKLINQTTKLVMQTISCRKCAGGSINVVTGGYVIAELDDPSIHQTMDQPRLTFLRADWSIDDRYAPIMLPPLGVGSSSSPISNPVVDREGRIYILIEVPPPASRSNPAGHLYVYNATISSEIIRHDFVNPQSPRGPWGVQQMQNAWTLTIDPIKQSIVVTSEMFVFQTKSFISSLSPSPSLSTSVGVTTTSSTGSSLTQTSTSFSAAGGTVTSTSSTASSSSSSSSASLIMSSSSFESSISPSGSSSSLSLDRINSSRSSTPPPAIASRVCTASSTMSSSSSMLVASSTTSSNATESPTSLASSTSSLSSPSSVRSSSSIEWSSISSLSSISASSPVDSSGMGQGGPFETNTSNSINLDIFVKFIPLVVFLAFVI